MLNLEKTVIALGGGTPCFHNNMEIINKNGLSIYFKMSIDTLVNRLANAKVKRPLIINMSPKELKNFITDQLLKREPFYLQAHYKVKAKDINVDDLTNFIKEKYLSHSK